VLVLVLTWPLGTGVCATDVAVWCCVGVVVSACADVAVRCGIGVIIGDVVALAMSFVLVFVCAGMASSV
jgi:hypothetical protein